MAELARLLASYDPDRDDPPAQRSLAAVRMALSRLAITIGEAEERALMRAMCVPAREAGITLFPGAVDLLARVKARGARCVAVSNATWRDGEAYRRDFGDLGVGVYFDAVISSVDLGRRKPDPLVFEAALAAARCPIPARAVMIGNSEARDIEPALARGLRAIRVAIEEPRPRSTRAHAVATSLAEVGRILDGWGGAGIPRA